MGTSEVHHLDLVVVVENIVEHSSILGCFGECTLLRFCHAFKGLGLCFR